MVLPLAVALPQIAPAPPPALSGDSGLGANDAVTVFQQLVAQIVAQAGLGDFENPQVADTPATQHSGRSIAPASSVSAAPELATDPCADATAVPPPHTQRVIVEQPPARLRNEGTDRGDPGPKSGSADDGKKPSIIAHVALVPALLVAPSPLPPLASMSAPKTQRLAADTRETLVLQPAAMLEVRIRAQSADAPAQLALTPLAPEQIPPAGGLKAAPASAPAPATSVHSEKQPDAQADADHQDDPGSGRSDSRPSPVRAESKLVLEAPAHAAIAPEENPPEGSAPAAQTKVETGPILAAPPSPAPSALRETRPEPVPGSTPPPVTELALPEPKAAPPMRALALEFTPDGAHDIKVRLSEHAGDVHVSLHGTDPGLAGRVREGVSELVGSLAKAGYDAEAWSPGQSGQDQRRQQDDHPPSRRRSAVPAEEFSGMLQQQPIEEIV